MVQTSERIDRAPGVACGGPAECAAWRAEMEGTSTLAVPFAQAHWRDVSGYVHSEVTGGMADGPGVRHVVFLAGCVLRCLYCHNPDTWALRNGKEYTAGALVDEIARNAAFLRRHGGVTISGGEPLVQAPFASAVFHGCKALNLHTALDTNGFLGHRLSDSALLDIDLVLLDIKEWDPVAYRSLTGVNLEPTLRFARRLAQAQRPVWLRYVLVPGLTDHLDRIESLADYVASLGNVERVEVLPFHKMGESKWERLGLDYQLTDTLPPRPELVSAVRQIFASRGLVVPGT